MITNLKEIDFNDVIFSLANAWSYAKKVIVCLWKKSLPSSM
jgi:hypothetical protein